MDEVQLFRQLGISVLLGLLVGLQRERTEAEMAGFRTFPLITVFGTLCAMLGTTYGNAWMLGGGFAGVIALVLIGNIPKLKQEKPDTGITTEVAMLVMFAVGAFVVKGPWTIAVTVAFGVAILLQMKPQLHGFAAKVGDQDIRAILQFVLITFIVLPVLEEFNQDYDPSTPIQIFFPNLQLAKLDVLNPYEIWLMVVLVVAISLGGYVAYKLFGQRAGILLGGILGGIISSTATTVSFSRRTVHLSEAVGPAAIAIMIASTIAFIRVLLEIAITAPRFFQTAAGPILAMFVVSVVLAGGAWMTHREEQTEMPVQENPTQLKSALIFGVIYAVVLVAVAVGQEYFQDALYVIAAFSGMTDMDAITLSTSNFVREGRISPDVGWRIIIVATMSNLVFKAIVVATIGNKQLLKRICLLFSVSLISGAFVLLLWP
jgi:uncharacterized membrane protein (DUF4010 family)